MELTNRKMTEGDFFAERKEVLAQWPTGRDVDLGEAIDFHKSLPRHKTSQGLTERARANNEIHASTGMGKATIEEQIEMLAYVEKEGRADMLATTVDSFSRQNNYAEAERGLRESIEQGRSMLNGLPVVNHGVAGIRRIVESINVPLGMRYGAADPRLIDEIGIAGGHTETPTDSLMDYWHHSAKVTIEQSIKNHRYSQRLIGYYAEHGVFLFSGAQGFYGAGISPSLQIAAIVPQHLMMAEQGVKRCGGHVAAHGNLAQDVATARTLSRLSREYLDAFGYTDVDTSLSVSFSLVQYPAEIGANFAVVFMNTLMAKLCGALLNDIRTVAEAKGIPTKEDIAYSFRTAKAIQNFLQHQKIEVEPKALALETEMVEREARSIIEKLLEFGDGDPVVGTIKAVKSGLLTTPFATNLAFPTRVMSVKDAEGAVRYLNHGDLPFDKEIVEFHKGRIAEREAKRGKKVDYETLVSDLMAVSKGMLVGD